MDATTPQRLVFLDWLRIIAFAVLVPYHVGMYYVTWDFHVKSPFASHALEPWMLLSGPWRLSLLFIVSGAATSLMLQRGAGLGFLRSRTRRLLWPLAFGMAVIVPPQSYFQVLQQYDYHGSYLDFLGLYFRGFNGFCHGTDCLILPTWNHLWFLPYLWFYTLLAWLLRPDAIESMVRRAPRALGGVRLIVLPVVLLFVLRVLLAKRFPSTHAFFGDWFNHALYFGMFTTGIVFARVPGLWDRLMRSRWPALLIALACWSLLISIAPGWPLPLRQLNGALLQWCALVAAFGFARRHLNADNRWRARLTEAVFPVYILHQTIIIVLSQALLPLRWPPSIEGPVLVVGTFAASYASYALVRRIGVLRPWLGLSRASQGDGLNRREIAATAGFSGDRQSSR